MRQQQSHDTAATSEESLFAEARQLHSPADRAAFLDRACGGDAALRGRVQALLDAHFHAPAGILEAPPPDLGLTRAPDAGATLDRPAPMADPVGTTVGPYKLLEQIGEGGFGVVYLAEQLRPVRRRVALKIVKPGMDSKQVIARFEAERQALALMDHPNIAKVHDAGTTEQGRPYFVMELVPGTPITKYCDDHQLTPRERLELFVPVCHAVQHAHGKGVLHRDLKPSNVLVMTYDGKPVPKVIDFGVAKALHPQEQRLTEQTMFTGFGAVVGTLEYMAPEQAAMDAAGTDTRADVYSLGVLLYELLTGSTPLDRDRLKRAAFHEVLRIIKEEEPPRPSTRLSQTGQAVLATICGRRGTDARKLGRLVAGDLDWVVMRALEKDRNRRYDTASALAADVQRYLADEPVEARPPSAAYRLRKFARRNKGAFVAATLVTAALVLGLAGTTFGLLRASVALGRAQEARKDADGQKMLAQQKEAQATAEAAKARAVSDFVQRMLASVRPENARGKEVLVRQVLEQAAKQIDDPRSPLRQQPAVEAAVRATLGTTYRSLGLYPDAERHLAEALRVRRQLYAHQDHPDLAQSLFDMADLLEDKWDRDAAAPLARESLAMRRRLYGAAGHPDLAASLGQVARVLQDEDEFDAAESLQREALEMRRRLRGPEHEDVARGLRGVSLALTYNRPDASESERLLREALAMQRKLYNGEDHPSLPGSLNNLAVLLGNQDRRDEAESLYREALAMSRRLHGERHPGSALYLLNLGYLALQRGDAAEAERRFRETLAIREAAFGRESPQVADSLRRLAYLAMFRDDYVGAERLYKEALGMLERLHGSESRAVAEALDGLGVAQMEKGDFPAAERSYRRAVETWRAAAGGGHRRLAAALRRLGNLLANRGRHAEADAPLREAVAITEKRFGDAHLETDASRHDLAWSLHRAGNWAEAEQLYLKMLPVRVKLNGEWSFAVGDTTNQLARVLQGQRKFGPAEALLLGLKWDRTAGANPDARGSDDEDGNGFDWRLEVPSWFAELYRAWGKPQQAAEWEAKHTALLRAEADRLGARLTGQPADVPVLRARAAILAELGSLDEAGADLVRASELRPDDLDLANRLHRLGDQAGGRRNYAAAELFRRRSAAMKRRILGDDSVSLASTLHNLGDDVRRRGDLAGAGALYREAMETRARRLGPAHPSTVGSRGHLADTLRQAGDYPALEAMLADAAARLGADPAADPTGEARAQVTDRLFRLYATWDRRPPPPEGALGRLDEAVRLRPGDAAPLVRRATLHLGAGRFAEAAADYDRLAELSPADSLLHVRGAMLRLALGDVEAYRRAARLMAARFAASNDHPALERTVKVALLVPGGDADLALMTRLADRCVALDGNAWNRTVKGLADYRAGRYALAAESLAAAWRSQTDVPGKATAGMFLAMAQHQLERTAEARESFAAAAAFFDHPRYKALARGVAGANGVVEHDWVAAAAAYEEARGLVGSLSPGELAAARRAHWERALADLSRQVAAKPDDPAPLAARAKFYLNGGRFEEAEADCARLVRLAPADRLHWYYRGCLLAYLGDEPAYRAHCRAMLDQFPDSRAGPVLDQTTKPALLLPGGAGGDVRVLVERARRTMALNDTAWSHLLVGMAEYRADTLVEAAQWLEKCRKAGGDGGIARTAAAEAFLAMAHHRLGHANEARAALARSVALIEKDLPKAGVDDLAENTGGAENWLIAHVARREAEALLAGK